jgi:hypothetical protein
MIGVIFFDNNRIHKILNEYELIIEASIHDASHASKYRTSVGHYWQAMGILCQKKISLMKNKRISRPCVPLVPAVEPIVVH